MTAPARRSRRRSSGGGVSPTLARLTAAREQLDAEMVERRRREDELLTEYAAATDAVTEVEARRDQALSDLERQAAQVREAAAQELVALEARQAAVLVSLNVSGDRTAEELAQLVSLPVRRVRTLLRSHRNDDDAADAAGDAAADAAGRPMGHLPRADGLPLPPSGPVGPTAAAARPGAAEPPAQAPLTRSAAGEPSGDPSTVPTISEPRASTDPPPLPMPSGEQTTR